MQSPPPPPEKPGSCIEKTVYDDSRVVQVPRDLIAHLMTPGYRQVILEVSGADVEWQPLESRAVLRGAAEQVGEGVRLLGRVATHCAWGVREGKILRLLRPGHLESVLVRLSPMGLSLRPFEQMLCPASSVVRIGKDKASDLVIADALISRQHCVLELDFDRGGVYVVDTSTNGTFLNDVRLPERSQGKVLLSHGDSLCLKDPGVDAEFGYMVNLEDTTVRVWEHQSEDADIDRERAEKMRRRQLIGCGN